MPSWAGVPATSSAISRELLVALRTSHQILLPARTGGVSHRPLIAGYLQKSPSHRNHALLGKASTQPGLRPLVAWGSLTIVPVPAASSRPWGEDRSQVSGSPCLCQPREGLLPRNPIRWSALN
uniref:Uncharacterized protein n=1 Tax=Molossus molossus TaxID=27622 RepID=A0A7J8FAA9_MOLMO|nr:hypothetical protein HJG59_008620 [Molossus molossus]